MRDTGWAGNERDIGSWRLSVASDPHFPHRQWRARVFFVVGGRETFAAPTRYADSEATARRAAEDALRDLCRATLAALDAAHKEQ